MSLTNVSAFRLLCPLIVCSALATGCSSEEGPADAPPRVALVQSLQPADASSGPLRFAGVVRSAESSQLAFEVPGRVERFLIDEGGQIERGQPLAELDSTDYQLQLREAEARVAQLEADLARKRTLQTEGILAPAAVEQLQAQVVSAQVARDTARRNLGHATLKAPFPGTVAAQLVEPQMVVSAGTPVLSIQSDGPIEVRVDLPETAASALPLDRTLQAEGELVTSGASIELRYKEHSTQPSPGGRTYQLVLQGEPPAGHTLLPGMAVRVRLNRPAAQETDESQGFRVPLSALMSSPAGDHFIWIAVDGQAQRRDVEVVSLHEEYVVIRGERLERGSAVIVAGGSQLSDGLSVRAQERR
ncbi:efflux RND transporter periplasmic adaptor subunit [Halopseudomonas nanhaiensis]|uniref:efflux RND transporter periplasmic adaptor subunit n=1 Tax=Halopseudomonas nanhaiensis TaxID=2830842 RepID=UPI001CBF48C1|nr:efflux RND transporter periplasmic adaptor subunit [Halopseudomonas nanhaiensis]UAW97240.1 efflux RND transporter periplasmic adaptor subunit [Halopseudomonas nanhaiensis]